MNRLQKLAEYYSQFFLDVRFTPIGHYWVSHISQWFEAKGEHVNVLRPGEDWGVIITDKGNCFNAELYETYSGSVLYAFSFKEKDDLLSLLSSFQSQIDMMIDCGVEITR